MYGCRLQQDQGGRFRIRSPSGAAYLVSETHEIPGGLDGGNGKKLAESGENVEAIRRRLLARMHDVSEYMKIVKQRFCVWYNRSHQRRGTLWTERFKRVLVEGQGNPLQTMAAYIDLNPVRAGLLEDPKDYR